MWIETRQSAFATATHRRKSAGQFARDTAVNNESIAIALHFPCGYTWLLLQVARAVKVQPQFTLCFSRQNELDERDTLCCSVKELFSVKATHLTLVAPFTFTFTFTTKKNEQRKSKCTFVSLVTSFTTLFAWQVSHLNGPW